MFSILRPRLLLMLLPVRPVFRQQASRSVHRQTQSSTPIQRQHLRFPPFRRPFHSSTRTEQQKYQYQRFSGSPAWSILSRWAARPTFYYEVAGASGVVAAVYVANLKEVPGSGRRQFNIISPEYEKELGKAQYQQILNQYRGRILPPNDARVQRVRRIVERLIPHSGVAGNEWEVNVIDEPNTPNAFVIPGGKVFVFTGIFSVAGSHDDSGLATVLSHEIAHNVAHHVAEGISRGFILVGIMWLAEIFLGIPAGSSNLLLSLGFERPGSRKQESEADYIGLLMMSAACYDPEASVSFWDRMQQMERQQGGAPPQFLSTHPSSHNRQEQLRAWLPQAEERRQSSGCAATGRNADRFWTTVGRPQGDWR